MPRKATKITKTTTTFLRTNNSVMKIASSLREHPAEAEAEDADEDEDKDKDNGAGRDSAECFAGNIVVNILLSARAQMRLKLLEKITPRDLRALLSAQIHTYINVCVCVCIYLSAVFVI